jgi:hypothetical protein
VARRLNQRPDQLQDLPAIARFRVNDKVEQFHSILRSHDYGLFAQSAGLVDEILTSPRIAGVMEQRVAGLMAAPLIFEPADGRKKAERVAKVLGGKDKQSGKWRWILPQETLYALMTWALFLGVAVGQIIWRRSPDEWLPYLYVWHPQHLRWDWMTRRFVLQAANGQVIVLPRPDQQPQGDGDWFVYCPFGVQGWTRGLIRSIGLEYLSSTWNSRDWDRHNERQGMALLKALVPSGGNDAPKRLFTEQLGRIGSEPYVMCPQGENGKPGYDVQKIEFEAQTWKTFQERKAAVDVDVAIRILGQNLTTEVQGGSRAASQTHELVRLDKALFDSEIGPALRSQVLTHWARVNYGDPELAPWPTYQVEPPEDGLAEANTLKILGEAVTALTTAESRVDGAAILEERGITLMTPEQLAAKEQEQGDQPDPNAPSDVQVTPEPTPDELAEIQKQISDQEGSDAKLTSVIVPLGEAPTDNDDDLPQLGDDWMKNK